MKTIAIIGSILFFSSCSVIIKNQGFKNYKSEEINRINIGMPTNTKKIYSISMICVQIVFLILKMFFHQGNR